MAKKVESTTLKAKQLVPIPLPDGQTSILMIDEQGRVYSAGETGWKPFPMEVES